MVSYLEQLLIDRNTKEENYLYTQWRLTKTFIPKVQAIIAHTFPHYSLHDSSHSETILTRIEMILGKDALSRLSITDIWLLLSSAYYHDVGMAMLASDIETIFTAQKFLEHVTWIQGNEAHSLHEYAQMFEVKVDGLYSKPMKMTGSSVDAVKFLLADYVRGKHHERSKATIEADSLLHFYDGPIPKRIINHLSHICECHGLGFDEVMALPLDEMGACGDECHPRFVACMLRLGDLLDIDNNRFSDVLLRTLSKIPEDSSWHLDKHLGIEKFNVTTKHIVAEAVCKKYEVYEITDQWFKMIREELGLQRDNWSNIAPDEIIAPLPVVEKLTVKLQGYDVIDGKSPSFTVDTSKAIELLRGSGFYENPAQSMRELLQNAVDASYMSVFLECEAEDKKINDPDELYVACTTRPIKVDIKQEKTEGDYIYWRVTIADMGIGMSKEDIGYLIHTGSRNPEKMKIVGRMPEFMKPSGDFGIGFQSVFLLTDEVKIETWKQYTPMHVESTMYDPTGVKKGRVLVKTDQDNCGKHGTKLSFLFKAKKIPSRVTFSVDKPLSSRVAMEYDFVKDEALDYQIAQVVQEIYQFGNASLCPVELMVDNSGPMIIRTKEKWFDYYSEKEGLQIKVYDGVKYMSRAFYRDQLVKPMTVSPIDFLAVDFNILSGNAKEILTLNRKDIRNDYLSKLKERVIGAVTEYITSPDWKPDSQLRALADMFLQQYHTPEELQKLNVDWVDAAWKEYGLSNKTLFKKIIKDCQKLTVRVIADNGLRNVEYLGKQGKYIVIKKSIGAGENVPLLFLLNHLASTTHKYSVYTSYSEDGKSLPCYELAVNKRPLIENWKGWFARYKVIAYSARTLMPCNEKYSELRVKHQNHWPAARIFDWLFDGPFMICPYVVEHEDLGYSYTSSVPKLVWNDDNEKLYQLVYENRVDESVTLEQIREKYKEFRKDTESAI